MERINSIWFTFLSLLQFLNNLFSKFMHIFVCKHAYSGKQNTLQKPDFIPLCHLSLLEDTYIYSFNSPTIKNVTCMNFTCDWHMHINKRTLSSYYGQRLAFEGDCNILAWDLQRKLSCCHSVYHFGSHFKILPLAIFQF